MLIYKLYYKEHIYIGKTTDLKRRFKEHCKAATTSNLKLYKVMREIGITKFKIEKIEELSSNELARHRELFYIRKLSTLNTNGLNKIGKIEETIIELKVQIAMAEDLIKQLEIFLET